MQDNNKFCKRHGGGRRCTYVDCTKSAQGKTNLCKAHGGGARCQYTDCKKSAADNTLLCKEHGGGMRCPHCKDWPDSRTGCIKYDGYCATCFKHVFPTDPRSTILRTKSHEILVRNYLNEHITGFVHDLPLYTAHCDCSHRRRIDHRLIVENTLIAVETDERQHKNYDPKDEEDRYDDLYMVFSGKWIFIRFNPDSYIRNGIRENPNIKTRLPVLLDVIQQQINRAKQYDNKDPVEIIRLFFDE